MKRVRDKAGKEPEGGSKKRKEVGIDSERALVSGSFHVSKATDCQ